MTTIVPDVNPGDLLSAAGWGDPVRQAIQELQAAPPAHGSTHQPGGADAIPTGVPGSSAPSDTPAAGTATSLARSDHRHGREAPSGGGSVSYGSPTASRVGDASADGVATTVTRSDHKHSREAFGAVAANTPGDAAANGTATTVARSDHKHGLPSFPVAHGFVGHVTGQAVANNVADPLEWTEDNDTDGFHAGTSNAIVIPAGLAGWYVVTSSLNFGSGGTTRRIEITKNGTSVAWQDGTVGTQRAASWTGPLAVGDTIAIAATANAAGVVTDGTVGMVLIGA
jgi:hypothetical protein